MKSIYSKQYKQIIERIKKARKEAGLMQKDAAKLLGVTQPYISKVEACMLRIDIVQLKQFAKIYNKDLAFFLNMPSAELYINEDAGDNAYSAGPSGSVPMGSQKAFSATVRNFREMFESTSDCIWEIDKNGKFTYVSPRFVEMLGYTAEEVIGKTPLEFMPAEEAAKVEKFFKKLSGSHNAIHRFRCIKLHKDGHEIVTETRLTHFYNPNDEYEGSIGIDRNLTSYNGKTGVGDHEENLMANMSHELRTPLNVVIGMSELLMNTQLTEEQKWFVKSINASSETLLGTIRDIFNFSKIQSGTIKVKNTEFDIRDLLENTLETADCSFTRPAEVLCLTDSALPATMIGDQHALKDIFRNLICTAIKLSSDKTPVLIIRASIGPITDVAKNTAKVAFTLTTANAQVKSQASEDLWKEAARMDTMAGGSGLGLPISKALVSAMGGAITLEKNPDGGINFLFSITFEIPEGAVSPSQVQKTLTGLNICVIEDNRHAAGVYREMLSTWGAQPEIYPTLRAFFAALPGMAAKPEIMLADSRVEDVRPGFIAKVREQAGMKDCKVVLMALPTEKIDIETEYSGLDSLITKPVKQSALLDIISYIREGHHKDERRPLPSSSIPTSEINILVVEDNPVNLNLVKYVLANAGYKVETAKDGKMALAAVRGREFDIIIMDIKMPEMDGYEATKKIREMEWNLKRPRVPIVALTADATREAMENCEKYNMDAFLTKPLRMNMLLETIQRLTTAK